MPAKKKDSKKIKKTSKPKKVFPKKSTKENLKPAEIPETKKITLKEEIKKEENPFENLNPYKEDLIRYTPETTTQWFEEEDYKIIKQPIPLKYKIFLTLILTIFGMVTLIGASLWFEQIFFDSEMPEQVATEENQLEENENSKYLKINLLDINAYSKDWVEDNFTEDEIANPLISAPDADPDKDGLSNSQEFILDTNPRKKVSFCPVENCTDNDGDLIQQGIHPISKSSFISDLDFVLEEKFIKNPDTFSKIIFKTNQKDINFSYLFSLEKSSDLPEKVESIEVLSSENIRFSDYEEKMRNEFNYLRDQNSLSLFLNFYSLDEEEYQTEFDKLSSQLETLKNITVPENFIEYQQISILILEKMSSLIELKLETGDYEFEDEEELEFIKSKWVDIFHLLEERRSFES